MAKFGILGCFYNCEENITSVSSPFEGDPDLLLAAVSCPFVGFPPSQRDSTVSKLGAWEYVYSSDVPVKESDARNMPLNFLLFNEVDYVWLLDGDEFYTEEQVQSIKKYVETYSGENNFFSVNFKNVVFDGSVWVDGFCPPRIFSNKIHGGIKEFYWDNDVLYEDGTQYKHLINMAIPRKVAHVKHLTWLNNELGRKKVEYQKQHFGACSYRWDEAAGELRFDEAYHEAHGIEIPHLNKL